MEKAEAVAALAALAQDNRLDVFRLLVRAGAAGMPAGRIAERLDIASPTLSFHLAQLKHADLVSVRREGRSLIYAVDYARMNGLMEFLTDNCCAASAPVCEPRAARLVRRKPRRVSARQET